MGDLKWEIQEKHFADALLEIGGQNDRVLSVSCDSASGSGMTPFNNTYPDRYIEVGISEQTGVDIAAGLAVNGFIPVISAIAPFISMRAYEQVRNDVGYCRTNVKLIGSSSGFLIRRRVPHIRQMKTLP